MTTIYGSVVLRSAPIYRPPKLPRYSSPQFGGPTVQIDVGPMRAAASRPQLVCLRCDSLLLVSGVTQEIMSSNSNGFGASVGIVSLSVDAP